MDPPDSAPNGLELVMGLPDPAGHRPSRPALISSGLLAAAIVAMVALLLATGRIAHAQAAPGPDQTQPDPTATTVVPIVELTPDDDALPPGQVIQVGALGEIDLHVKELELTRVLEVLSLQSRRNIVASKAVDGEVSADLYGVDFYEALDAILKPNGYGYREDGRFIYVYTRDELTQMAAENRELVHKIVRLDYINATDASAFVSPLLSEAGQIAVSAQPQAGMKPSVSDGGANSSAHVDTLVIRDFPENVEQIVAALDELDRRPQQVLVEATVLQAKLNENNALGVDFAIFADLDPGDFANPLGSVDELISGAVQPGSGTGLTSTPGNTQTGNANFKIGVMGQESAVFIRALDSITDTTVLATPRLLVLNRQRADLSIGEKLGYLSTTATDTSTTQTVELLEVGTQLSLRPFVSEDGFIRLELKPTVSDGNTTRVVNNFVIPETNNQELTTNVIIQSGQTVVLGGLFKEDTTINRQQVPGVGDIPLLGAAFKGQDDSILRSEVIFLVKATIVKDKSLRAQGERAMDDVDRACVGARQGLLPWSRSKLVGSHLRRAMEQLEAGDRDKALWSVNLALYLQPGSVEAIRLKEQITGKRMRGTMSPVIRTSIDDAISGSLDRMPTPAPGDAPATAPAPGPASEAGSNSVTQPDTKPSPDANATTATATKPQPKTEPQPEQANASAALSAREAEALLYLGK